MKKEDIFSGAFNPETALAQHTALVDGALEKIAAQAGLDPKKTCIIATGGYGRNELAPASDVDLLFLCEDAKGAEVMQELCWNAGLKPACSVRTLAECEEGFEDIHFLTSLLERRMVWGSKTVFAKLDKVFQQYKDSKPASAFIAAKLAERDARHKKMGDTRYVLQPNVKEGKGALRDIQTLFWLSDFLHTNNMTEEESATLEKAHKFFSAVRCHLHLVSGSDRLSFEIQPDIAARMGYTDAQPNVRAEKFMKDYFLMTNEVGHLTRILCAALEAESLMGVKRMVTEDKIDLFPVKNGRLTFENPSRRGQTPPEIVRIFRVSQTSGLDIHPDALRVMRGAKDLHRDAGALKIFLNILLDHKKSAQTLRRMNEAGILGALIPAFDNIVAHMQYDMYHAFTADEHTLCAIEMLHKIENGELEDAAPLATELFRGLRSRRALYAAMFLHDTAKGTGGLHSEKGADIAKKTCPLLGLNSEETETAAWLVEHHLLMTMTAYKRDLNDPKTIEDFTAAVQSPERLKLLTLMTTADIMAVGPGKWNNWKAGLLSALYQKTAETMSGAPTGQEQIVAAQRQVRRAVGEKMKTFNMLVDYAPGYFWLGFSPATIASFVEALHKKEDIRITPMPGEDFTEVLIHAPDRKGLFATLSGALAAAGASIADARIFTLGNGMALDVFHVQNLNGHVYDNGDFLLRTLKQALAGEIDLKAEIAARQKTLPAKAKLFSVAPRVIIDNTASAGSTVIEVNGKDRPGFLHDVTSALTAEGLQISAAKIATFGSRAVDVFYVKDGFGLKILHNEKLQSIENKVENAIEE
jgi:[protein-PII] uridylyltransferase